MSSMPDYSAREDGTVDSSGNLLIWEECREKKPTHNFSHVVAIHPQLRTGDVYLLFIAVAHCSSSQHCLH